MIYRRTGILTLILTVLTVITGIMAGMMLHILVLIKDGGNMVLVMSMITETAVFMTAAISIYFILLMLKMTYRFRVFQKAEVTGTEIKSKMERRDCDIKAGKQKLQQKYTDAEKLHTARNRFVSWMSHDLRTPMNAILGYSMLIEKDSDDRETVKHYAGQILSSGQILLELINDMLDMGCIENGNIKLVENEFSLLSAMEEVQAVIRPQAEAKNQVFTFSITNPAGIDMIVGDK